MLEAINIQKSYSKRRVVDGISLKISQGEIVGLLGPNGAGKSTSFYMIVGLIALEGGKIQLNNQDISQEPLHRRAQLGIGYLPQEASVFRRLSVEKNIMAILELRKDLNKTQRQEKCESLISEFGLGHVKKTAGMALSGGERRRVEIARALATDPKFILLDEPFAGIDPISVIDIKKIIHQLKERGLGVLITDHNVRETLDICERAYIVSSGHIIAQGPPQEILDNKQVREVYLGDQFSL